MSKHRKPPLHRIDTRELLRRDFRDLKETYNFFLFIDCMAAYAVNAPAANGPAANGPEYGLHNTEFAAFDTLVSWIHEKTGAPQVANSVMQCLLSVDTQAYINNRVCMGPIIRKILRRAMEARALFKSISKCAEPTRSVDMFSSETTDVLYPITSSGLKVEAAASDDSWAYNFIINGLVCPTTREPIVQLAKGTPVYATRASEAAIQLSSLNIPSLFKISDAEAADLWETMDMMDGMPPFDEPPYNFLNSLEFEEMYGIPTDRRFSTIYAQNIVNSMVANNYVNVNMNAVNALNAVNAVNNLFIDILFEEE